MAYQVKPDTDPLERDRREIERRRARFEDRKQRILHAKTRVIGVDTDALDQQVQDRKDREKAEKERDLSYDYQSLHHAKTMTGYEEKRKHENRNRLLDLSSYHKQQQINKSQNDSTAKLSYTSYSIPSTSIDSNYSNSSTIFLQFPGEDPTYHQRIKQQQQQQQEWLTTQLLSLSLKEQKTKQEEIMYHNYQQQILQIQNTNESMKQDVDKHRRKQFQQDNVQLASEKKEREKQAKEQEVQLNQYELTTTLRSAFLNEQPGPAGSESQYSHSASPLHNSGATVVYGFKGFSTAQKQAILNEQAEQQLYNKADRLSKKEEEKEYAIEQEEFRRESIRLERKKREEEAKRRVELAKERLVQDKEKQGREEYLKKVVYTNPVSDDFFKQFGTSCR